MNDFHKKLSTMCWIYLSFSLFFYLALIIVVYVPFIAPIGLHSLYHMFLLGVALTDVPTFPGITLAKRLCVVGVFVMGLLFLVFLVMALWKKKYSPFGWLTVVNNLIVATVTVMAIVVMPDMALDSLARMTLPGLIGNAIFSWRYFCAIKEMNFNQDVMSIEDRMRGN